MKTIKTISPFKKMIMTIGNLPTAFVESMTYYEALAWFCDFLQNTVIPTVNNNAEAVEELQGLFIELKNYVDNYFENTDFQNLVNNKLDEMASDGTLAEIINQEIFGDLNNSRTYWKNVVSLGLHNDGITANDTLLQNILSTAENGDVFYFPKGTYLFNNKVTFSNLENISLRFEGDILSENGVIFDTLTRCNIYGIRIKRNYTRFDYTTLLNTGLEIKNSKYLMLFSPYVEGFNNAYFWHSDGQSNSYNTIYNIHSFDNLHGWNVINENGGFTNEINSFGGRFSLNTGNVDVSGIASYINIPSGCNMNNFYGICLEGAFNKITCNGNYNSFIACRLEYQDSNNEDVVITGYSNTILGCYWSEQTGGPAIVNNGLYNTISSHRQFINDKINTEITKIADDDYTLNRTYNNILCDCTNKNIKITLPLGLSNFKNTIIRITKIDDTDNYVYLYTQGQSNYNYIGRGALLKTVNDFVELYYDGEKWRVININKLYSSSLTDYLESNLNQGLIYQDNNNLKIINQGGTNSNVQITNTYCNTVANSTEINLIVGSTNRTLRQGNYIKIAGENKIFRIINVDYENLTATLDKVTDNTQTNVRITYQYPSSKFIGLLYDKVDNIPSTDGNIGDIVFYNNPTSYIGAVYTSNGWKNFGAIDTL